MSLSERNKTCESARGKSDVLLLIGEMSKAEATQNRYYPSQIINLQAPLKNRKKNSLQKCL